jgi:hypothetical protein
MRDTIDMAREAWISEAEAEMLRDFEECYLSCTYLDDLKAFEALVRADEREACAKVCEDIYMRGYGNCGDAYDAIRARGNT